MQSLRIFKKYSILLWSVGLVYIGVLHLAKTEFFRHVMPPYFPTPDALVFLSGVVEILFGLTFWQPKWRFWIAIGIVLMLISYLPVHIYMITDNDVLSHVEPQVTLFIAWLRLPLQFVFIGWVWWLRQ